MIMLDSIPSWIWLLAVGRSLLGVGFVVFAGVLQGRTHGTWPTLTEWCGALRSLRLGPLSAPRQPTMHRPNSPDRPARKVG
jgi:hypothetical protein